MLLNLLTVSALLGVVAATGYANGYNNVAADGQASIPNGNAYFVPGNGHYYHGRRNHHNRHRWGCRKLGTFVLPSGDPFANGVSAPKIAYYTRQGEEMAIVVCQSPQIQVLFGKSPNANVEAGIVNAYKDNALLSVSTMSGLTMRCNRRERRYEAYNFLTEKTIPIDQVACLTVEPAVAAGALSLLPGILNGN